jgi:4-amino-4-deoxy-L-arabinose transferase-like glycosyltransferase
MDSTTSRFPLKELLAGILVYLAMQCLVVGVPSIGGSSEAREAQVVDVIVRDGTWVLPLRNGIIPSKPPLYHWAGALLSEALGGVSEFSVRLNSQIAASVVLIFVAVVAYRFASLSDSRLGAEHPRRAALLGAGITSLTYGFYVMANQAMVDMTFTLCVWGALASLAISRRVGVEIDGRLSGLSRFGFFLFCALGVLARGPVGAALPMFLVFLAGALCLGVRQTLREFVRPTLGWLAFCMPLGWYYLAYQAGGDAFLKRQILFENLQRIAGGTHVNSESWWFYAPSFLRTTFPWGVLVLLLLWTGLREHQTFSYPSAAKRLRWLPSVLCCAGIALFSLSSGKRHSYLLPLVPLVGVQLAVEVSRLFGLGSERMRAGSLRAGRRFLRINTAIIVIVLGVGAIFSGGDYTSFPQFSLTLPPILHTVERFGVILVTIVAFGSLALRRSHQMVFRVLWFQCVALVTLAVNAGAAAKAHLKGFDEMASVWLSDARDGEQLAVVKHPFDEYFDPMLYYVKRPVKIISTESSIFQCAPRVVYVAKRDWIESRDDSLKRLVTHGTILRERLLAQSGDSRRDVVLFRCDSDEDATDPSVPTPAMKEAALKTRNSHWSVGSTGM